MRRLFAVAHKELRHIWRDPRSLFVAIMMPLAMVVIYSYAIDMDLRSLRIGLLDLDRTTASDALVREAVSSGYIVIAEHLTNRSEVETGFRRDRFRAALLIPQGYGESLERGPAAQVQFLIDGADGTTAATVDNYLNAVVARLNQRLNAALLGVERFPIEPQTRVWFNLQMLSANFVAPGLVAIVMMMVCALLTSIAIARERETGTMEQILTTPIHAAQVIAGKILPYLGIGAIDAAIIIAVGRFVFDVPMNGSWWALSGYSGLYILVALALGLLVSTIAKTQQLAMMIALVATLLPTLMLSGFIFPIASMPVVLQWISRILPATYFLRIIRGVMLNGKLWYPLEGGIILLMLMAIITLAVVRFRGKAE